MKAIDIINPLPTSYLEKVRRWFQDEVIRYKHADGIGRRIFVTDEFRANKVMGEYYDADLEEM